MRRRHTVRARPTGARQSGRRADVAHTAFSGSARRAISRTGDARSAVLAIKDACNEAHVLVGDGGRRARGRLSPRRARRRRRGDSHRGPDARARSAPSRDVPVRRGDRATRVTERLAVRRARVMRRDDPARHRGLSREARGGSTVPAIRGRREARRARRDAAASASGRAHDHRSDQHAREGDARRHRSRRARERTTPLQSHVPRARGTRGYRAVSGAARAGRLEGVPGSSAMRSKIRRLECSANVGSSTPSPTSRASSWPSASPTSPS